MAEETKKTEAVEVPKEFAEAIIEVDGFSK